MWYVDADGGLDLDKLLADFQGFFREHFEPRRAAKRGGVARFDYAEAGPQLLLQGTIREGLLQTAEYMDRCAAQAGHLVNLRPRRRQAVGGQDLPPRRTHR